MAVTRSRKELALHPDLDQFRPPSHAVPLQQLSNVSLIVCTLNCSYSAIWWLS